jgi:GT2 family glycosyltransferase
VWLEIVICTHNRRSLLQRALASLNDANRVESRVQILVVANACTDDTVNFLRRYNRGMRNQARVPLVWIQEPRAGKSYALNRAIALAQGDVVAFVDDDQRVHSDYLRGLCRAAENYPDAGLLCGRLLPDWDGSEPPWVHDKGSYAIYPLPVPRYDRGDAVQQIDFRGPFPSGGNLAVRRQVLQRIGNFCTALGPRGHNLVGGEDGEFVSRALRSGERLCYVPEIIQYHYVDPSRFRLRYLLRRSYLRSRAALQVRLPCRALPPAYLWRKLAQHIWHAATGASSAKTRFYLIRSAATLGEISAYLTSTNREKGWV